MDPPKFIRHFPLLIRVCTSLDVESGELNRALLLVRVLVNVALAASTSWCLTGGELGRDAFAKSHDLLTLFVFLSNQVWLLRNHGGVTTLAHFLVDPLDYYRPDSAHSRILEEYTRKTNRIARVCLWFIAVTGVLWAFTPMGFLLDFKTVETQKCLHLPVGWIPSPSSSHVVITITVVCALSLSVMNLTTLYGWTLTLIMTTLKIKLKIKLLRADLSTLEQRAESMSKERKLIPISKLSSCETFKSESGKSFSRIRRNTVHSPRDFLVGDGMTEKFRFFKDSGEEVLEECLTQCLNEAAKKHAEILKYVRFLNDSFKVSMLIYTQIGILAAALAVPKISSITHLTSTQFLHRSIEVTGTLMVTATFCYCGQIILNQSEKLRFALYDSRWLEKRLGFKRHFHLMQTVATKPLRITAGGIYTLSMETYTTILSAAYSYASLLQSFKNEDI